MANTKRRPTRATSRFMTRWPACFPPNGLPAAPLISPAPSLSVYILLVLVLPPHFPLPLLPQYVGTISISAITLSSLCTVAINSGRRRAASRSHNRHSCSLFSFSPPLREDSRSPTQLRFNAPPSLPASLAITFSRTARHPIPPLRSAASSCSSYFSSSSSGPSPSLQSAQLCMCFAVAHEDRPLTPLRGFASEREWDRPVEHQHQHQHHRLTTPAEPMEVGFLGLHSRIPTHNKMSFARWEMMLREQTLSPRVLKSEMMVSATDVSVIDKKFTGNSRQAITQTAAM